MKFTRTYDRIVSVWMDGPDTVFLTEAHGKFRILAERMSNARRYASERMNRPVEILGMGDVCEFIW